MDINSGYIIINKDKDITSFKVVNKIKWLSKLKAGHTGTLDPMATGVLPVLLGSSTKLSNMIMEGKKEYIAEAVFGFSTDTLDVTGTKTNEIDISNMDNGTLKIEKLRETLESFLGTTIQVPPMYSALKKDGKKLYELARKGIEVEREGREIVIEKIELLSYDFPTFKFKVSCSKGTYIRSLIDDIGSKLNIPCTMSNLIRSKTGSFNIENSVKLEELTKENIYSFIRPIEELFLNFESISINKKIEKLLINGVTINDKSILNKFKENANYRISNEENKFLGLVSKKENELKMIYRV